MLATLATLATRAEVYMLIPYQLMDGKKQVLCIKR